MTVCPCCQRELEGVLAPDQVAEFVHLTHQQRIIFDFLSRRLGHLVPTMDVVDALFAGRADGGPNDAYGIYRQQAHYLRKKIEPFGLTVKGYGGRLLGNGQTCMKWRP